MIREEKLDNYNLETQQQYKYYKGYTNEGVYTYSFGLDNSVIQPSGHCNFSHINKVDINFGIKTTAKDELYDLIIYNRMYNILKLQSGIAELLYFK